MDNLTDVIKINWGWENDMNADNEQNNLEHLLVNIAGPIVEFALVRPDDYKHLHSYKKYRIENFATATDSFQTYAKDMNIALKGRQCAMSVSAAVHGDVIKIMRGSWTFSLLGFSHLFGQKPIAINNASALSWANIYANEKSHKPLEMMNAHGPLDMTKAGKYLTILMYDGVGLASLMMNGAGQNIVIDSEHGHTGFYPASPLEKQVMEAIKLGKIHISWEHILNTADSDPFWKKLNLSLDQIGDLKCSVLGNFAGDAALSQTSWSGVFLYGNCANYLNSPKRVELFNKRFEEKSSYRMNIRNIPRYLVNMEHQELLGCAAMLANR